MHFDIATAMTVTSLLTFGVGVSLMFATWRYPANLRGAMRIWVGGVFLQALALLAIGTFGFAPATWMIVLFNTIYALAYAEMGRALNRFAGRRNGFTPMLLVAAVALISFVLGAVWNEPRWRIALNSVPLAALQCAVALPILRTRASLRAAGYLTGILFLACAALTLARSVVEILGPGLVPTETSVVIRNIVLVFSAILPILGTIGFMLMCGDHLNDDLARLAMRDPLTGVYNRRTLAGLAERAIDAATRANRPLALLAVDVDHFKRVNDQLGHDVGDDALCGLVMLMEESLKPEQTLSRIGGEEFAVLLPNSSEADACLVAERLRRHVERSPVLIDGRPLQLRVSIGVAALTPTMDDLGALLRDADRALYSAKRAGRNRVVAASKMQRAPVHVLRRDTSA
ncbi:MAG: GGDEF domain-containing protein [Dokdonella sp.]